MATLNLGIVDLGAESGRVLLGSYDGERLMLQEVHRFLNRPVQLGKHLHWNVLSLWQEIVEGLREARNRAGVLHSVGVDTWGVDYALLDEHGYLLGMPFHYRDGRVEGMMERAFARVSREEIYQQTGIQFMPINTLYQLMAHQLAQPALLQSAHRFLMMPDLLHNWLCGEQAGERTNATTTQCWSVARNDWAHELLHALELPSSLLPAVVEPGTRLGTLLPELAQDLGSNVRVIVPATHDTASAVAAIPASGTNWAYISSGTWSLVGLELPAPSIAQGSQANFTNEGGVFGSVRFLRNVMGLWLVQECRRTWEREGQLYTYEELFALADKAPAFSTLINPDDPDFLAPGDMPVRIERYAREHGQRVPASVAFFVRTILESLTLRYRQILELATQITGVSVQAIHVVGGGAQNAHLNQWIADATGLPVIAGPVEASASGNALMQLVGLGELKNLPEVRLLSTRSTSLQRFEPDTQQRPAWNEAYERFQNLLQQDKS
jgi:rhamnulokinase